MLLKRFPVEYQMDSQDCGPASLKIIAKYFGKFYSLQYLRDRCGITKEGVSLLALSTGAESIGLRTLAIKCVMDDVVNSIPLPAIVFWKENHFVVVYGTDKRYVYVSDPAKGRIKYTHEQFKKGWCRKGEEINEMPKGFETMIGENGRGLSGGQKQRLLIARALYRSPRLLFLDEATNSLDVINERKIVDALNGAFKDRTVIVVAHRLSTIRNVDQIVVLEKGFIAEIGNHQTLMEKKGHYFNLVSTQMA